MSGGVKIVHWWRFCTFCIDYVKLIFMLCWVHKLQKTSDSQTVGEVMAPFTYMEQSAIPSVQYAATKKAFYR